MAIGVSGTRNGMNSAQYMEVERILEEGFDISGGVLLHGDCVGVDEECHRIGRRLGYTIEIYPPRSPKFRAFCEGDVHHLADEYLARNRAIVGDADTMLIVPDKAPEDAPRSGTWYTYRYSLEVGKPTTLVIGGRFEYVEQGAGNGAGGVSEEDPLHMPPLEGLSRRKLPPTGRSRLSPDDLFGAGSA